jgi:hypothetical protein
MVLQAGDTQRKNAEQTTLMDAQFDWLNKQIDNMQAGKSLLKGRAPNEYEPSADDVDILGFAARLNALRPGAATPASGFISALRERVLASVESS